MNVLVLTEEQAADLAAGSAGSLRQLIPRRLKDGRLILNADVLTDDFFVGAGKRWRAALLAAPAPVTAAKADLDE